MFSKIGKKGHNKLKSKWNKQEEYDSEDSEDEEAGPQLPSKYLGEKIKKLSKEEEAERQIKQRELFKKLNEKNDRTQSLTELHKNSKKIGKDVSK